MRSVFMFVMALSLQSAVALAGETKVALQKGDRVGYVVWTYAKNQNQAVAALPATVLQTFSDNTTQVKWEGAWWTRPYADRASDLKIVNSTYLWAYASEGCVDGTNLCVNNIVKIKDSDEVGTLVGYYHRAGNKELLEIEVKKSAKESYIRQALISFVAQ